MAQCKFRTLVAKAGSESRGYRCAVTSELTQFPPASSAEADRIGQAASDGMLRVECTSTSEQRTRAVQAMQALFGAPSGSYKTEDCADRRVPGAPSEISKTRNGVKSAERGLLCIPSEISS
jgi:hypothetical protein